MVIAYTDGSARGNPGNGGFGVVLMSPQHKLRKEISAGFRLTTNNRMELLAVIVALESLKKEGTDITIYSDSKYVIDAIEKRWVFGWQRKGFKGKKNADLWERFLKVYPKHHLTLKWVRGHSGVPENERCDQLAVQAAEGKDLLIDRVFEQKYKSQQLLD